MFYLLAFIGSGFIAIALYPVDTYEFYFTYVGILLVAEAIILTINRDFGRDIKKIKDDLRDLKNSRKSER